MATEGETEPLNIHQNEIQTELETITSIKKEDSTVKQQQSPALAHTQDTVKQQTVLAHKDTTTTEEDKTSMLAVSVSNGCVTKPPSTPKRQCRPPPSTVPLLLTPHISGPTISWSLSTATGGGGGGGGGKIPHSSSCRFYAVQGNNAIGLVESILNGLNWIKVTQPSSNFTLKWADLRTQIDFKSFKEGDQLVNHFPNITLLTTKIGLLESIRSSRRKLISLRLPVHQIIPETYRLDVMTEREEFFKNYIEKELWICKPTGANQGKGIFLVHSLKQIEDKLASDVAHCPLSRHPTQRIVQRYISSPLLIEGRKFDIRVYMLLIAGEKLIYAFYRDGYIRLSCLQYDISSKDMTIHLTNQYVQKKHPSYTDLKEDTVWDFNKFQAYLTKHYKLPEDWISTTLTHQMKQLMLSCYHSVVHKLDKRMGYFELLGFDFMLDANYHLWLIEVNINPALHTNCETLKNIIPNTVEETIGMAIEVWSKSRRSRTVFPINAQKDFCTIFPV